MSEWDDPVVSGNGGNGSSQRAGGSGGGRWHIPLTLLALLAVGAFSFLMSYLTRDVMNRLIWMMGLLFMVPAGTMFFSALVMEFQMGAMTPRLNRSMQIRIAVVATLLTFIVGSACDAIYLLGGAYVFRVTDGVYESENDFTFTNYDRFGNIESSYSF